MAPIINISKEVLEHLEGLGIVCEEVETPKPTESLNSTTEIDYQVNPSDYILLEGKSGKEGYPDLWVCKYRLGTSSVVENAGKSIRINLKNTAQEKNGRRYIGNINREQAVKLNLTLGGRTLNTRLGKDFFALLLSEEAFDGKGKKIKSPELSQIANEIMQVRAPYRAELFEDYFSGTGEELILNKNYVLDNGVLKPEYSRNLTNCLMEDRTSGIDLKNWLENSTAQGFPRKHVKSGNLWYWHPRVDKSVGFLADSDYAYFDCGRYPQGTCAGLGVRHVREAHAKK